MSLAAAMRPRVEERSVKDSRVQWPSPAWRGRHLEFARDVLGYRVLARLQQKIINAYYAHERAKIVVCTGQKWGKTEVEIICVLGDFATEKNLNYFLFAPKIDHTNEVLWPRLVQVALAAYYPCRDCMPAHRTWCALVETDPLDETPRPERCPNCSPLIPSEWKNPKDKSEGRVSAWLNPEKSEGGLRAPDGRVVRGYAARKLGAKGGLSGAVRIGSDESSDIDDETEDSWDGNLMGGGKRISFGNLLYGYTKWFGKAFAANRNSYTAVFQESSRMSPNCKGRIEWSDGAITENGRWIRFPGGTDKRPEGYFDSPHATNDQPIKGLADVIGIEKYLDGGKRSKNKVAARVDAGPPAIIEGQLAGLARIAAAEQRWPLEEPSGILQFGVDVGRVRDPFVIAVRRGNSIRELLSEVLGDDDYTRAVDKLIDTRTKYIKPHERNPRLVYDASGKEGKRFRLELEARKANELFDVYPIYATFKPRDCTLYDKKRDELACHFAEWLKYGSIVADVELEAEIEATTAERVEVSYGSSGHKWPVQRVISNDELRKPEKLGRSPDKRNACELATWDVDGSDATEVPTDRPTRPDAPQAKAAPANDVFEQPLAPMSIYERHAMATRSLRGYS